jgi:hypothetical protein
MLGPAPATEPGSGPATLRLGLDAGLLPAEARWFYLEAVGTAVRNGDGWTLERVPPGEELAHLLEVASGSKRVVEIGAQTGWTALALALSDHDRSVISFGRPGASQGPGRYAGLVDASVRARVGSRERRVEEVPPVMPGPADIAHVDLSPPYAETYGALVAAALVVRPGGLVVVRGGGELDTLALIEELDLEASIVDGLIVGRKPLEPDWEALLEQALAPTPTELRETERQVRPPRTRLLALGLAGSLVGAGAGLALPIGDLLGSDNRVTNPAREGSREPGAAVGRGGAASSPRSAAPGRSERSSRSTASAPSVAATPRQRGRQRSGRGSTVFSGTGTRKLGTIRVDEPVFLRWSTGGGAFRIVSEAWGFRPRTRKGRLLLSPGAYRRFEVRGRGRWRLELTKP